MLFSVFSSSHISFFEIVLIYFIALFKTDFDLFCRRDTPIESLIVQLGDHDLTLVNETKAVLRGVRRIFFHSHFHAFLLVNDIALLQLDEPVTFTDNIQPVCLPDPGQYVFLLLYD